MFFFYSGVIFKMLFIFQDVQTLQLKPIVMMENIVLLTSSYVILNVIALIIVGMKTTAKDILTLGPKKAQK